ncbi:GTP cyclohydrolase I FolE [Caldinitratiruptor microaerophilus]|uniref:GTP cyclohydrolase 1 n=1 Tax=Caldinitratiruptor microaerophilus TaxID=671077 RepID=A0AA35CNN0_9FIRM|nr:GTP cyclohydrolase I FolE [Caldinitratiruptor microaerophilus]BDG60912.1 GTP cyclohydrolase 1 [Caldinitratiruptor microaerophilus]
MQEPLEGRGGVDKEKIERAVRMILEAIGEDPDREGLRETPRRIADFYEEVTVGLRVDPGRHLATVFHEDHHEEMVIVKDIPFQSLCEHHLVPFVGKAHVVYIPRDGRLVGLSKLARVVEEFSRRPQLQERLTSQVADLIVERLNPLGVMVVIEAEHMCMTMRGVRKPGSITVTSAVRGAFAHEPATRAEAMALIKGVSR